MTGAKKGDLLLVHFTSITEDGDIFESSKNEDPQRIVLGDGNINPAFEEALYGKKPGDVVKVDLPAENAYGEYNKRLVFKLRKKGLNFTYDPKPGQIVNLKLPTGQNSLVKVMEINTKTIKVDANHPMAGMNLTYELELIDLLPE
ncbi:peptidylprolyl isomerase [Methanoplanus sp. FWC-SCC4]|uniref:Peptidyl-prolyl cis-trans isomerase n=1 Tax=Methanochimaera problematica TaxID=2609417 RepID=A0AA97FCP0_9EURY|nr:FKBP-type peptidyl-prolyl cis-trans isomerase [Methanoplanus sp. FWC-SCC4]WOF16097.1 peptidylprolyl isomerase [Methanoplanus sp. FWC-SCC4]